jgi:integral membrane protein
MLKTALGRFRLVGLYEGISFLVLLGIAMPLKYFADIPQAVSVVGMLHGLLFVLYLLTLAHVTLANRWSIIRVLGAIIASLIPFGTFVLDARLRRQP